MIKRQMDVLIELATADLESVKYRQGYIQAYSDIIEVFSEEKE